MSIRTVEALELENASLRGQIAAKDAMIAQLLAERPVMLASPASAHYVAPCTCGQTTVCPQHVGGPPRTTIICEHVAPPGFNFAVASASPPVRFVQNGKGLALIGPGSASGPVTIEELRSLHEGQQ